MREKLRLPVDEHKPLQGQMSFDDLKISNSEQQGESSVIDFESDPSQSSWTIKEQALAIRGLSSAAGRQT